MTIQKGTPVQSVEDTEQQKISKFVSEYQALCDKYGYQIQVTPAYRMSQDTGTWQTVLQTSIGKLPEKV